MVCVCSIDSGSGELGIEPATPWLQGISLITTPWHNYNGLFTLWLILMHNEIVFVQCHVCMN